MEIRHSHDQRFDALISRIKRDYSDDILKFSGVHPSQLDIAQFTREFLFGDSRVAVADQSVDSNANIDDRSVVSFDHEVAKAESKLNALHMIWSYIIKDMYDSGNRSEALQTANEAIRDIITCALYLNDSHFAHKAYCYSFDLSPLVAEGMPFVKKVYIGPPKHFTSMINLVVQATAFISNQIAGAVSYPNLLIYLDYFARKDFGERYWEKKSTLDQLEQGFQNLVYSLNFSFRGSQSAFTNMSIYDRQFLEELFSTVVYPDGSSIDMDSVSMIQKLFMDWFNKESEKQIFTFPVMTANLVADDNGEILDKEFLDYVSEANLSFGLLNFYTGPATCLSSCCRLRSELVREHTNSLGTGSVSIGSHRVCTVNLPRIAIEAEGDEERFMSILERRLMLTTAVLNAHRRIVKELISCGRLPLYNYEWMHLSRQYSTVGLIGPYEACKFMGYSIVEPNGSDFIVRVMDYINERNQKEEKKWNDGRRFNLELIPGEQAAIKMCEADKMLYPSFPNPYSLYSNQFIPLIEDTDVYSRMKLQGLFDSRAQGGCIMHLNMDHKINNKEQMKKLIVASTKAGALYYAVNLNIAICEDGHMNVGKISVCQICGKPIETNLTRVVGFITSVSDWNKVRRWEYERRYFYNPDSELTEVCQEERSIQAGTAG